MAMVIRRVLMAMLVTAAGASLMTACLPADANPDHVVLVDSLGRTDYVLQNRTGYPVRIDRQEFVPTPQSFSPATIPAGQDAHTDQVFESTGAEMGAKVWFTLVGAQTKDGGPVTGVAEVHRTRPVIS